MISTVTKIVEKNLIGGIIIFTRINQTDCFHLYYLISNGIKKGEKWSGLAHVAEHTCLIPSCTTKEYIGLGYTGIDHACIYFVSDSLSELQRIDEDFMYGAYITEENVEIAKHQVEYEINNLFRETQEKERLIGFITNNRIKKFAMGEIYQIVQITVDDVKEWFKQNIRRGDIHKFLFRNVEDIKFPDYIYPTYQCSKIELKNDKRAEDRIYYMNKNAESDKAEIYFSIPVFYDKSCFVKKALFEYCIQRKIFEILEEEIDISEKYYDYNERFDVISFQIEDINKLEDRVKQFRKVICNITEKEFQNYKKEFQGFITRVMEIDELNQDRINEIKNLILYDKPIIKVDDLKMIDNIKYSMFPIKCIARTTLKIVIK